MRGAEPGTNVDDLIEIWGVMKRKIQAISKGRAPSQKSLKMIQRRMKRIRFTQNDEI